MNERKKNYTLAESQRPLNATTIVLGSGFFLSLWFTHKNERNAHFNDQLVSTQSRLWNVIFLLFQRQIQIARKHINFHIRLPLCVHSLETIIFSSERRHTKQPSNKKKLYVIISYTLLLALYFFKTHLLSLSRTLFFATYVYNYLEDWNRIDDGTVGKLSSCYSESSSFLAFHRFYTWIAVTVIAIAQVVLG